MKLDIAINTDDNYIQHTMAMLCSLYENNRKHKIIVHVLQSALSEKSRNYITNLSERYGNKTIYYTVNEEPLQGVQFRKNRPLSMSAYYRLMLSSVLPHDLDEILYIDCDVIVVKNIEEIFQIELGNYALAACLDRFPYSQQHRLQLHMEVGERTFCSGVMLVNLKYWREHNVEPGLLEYAKRHRKEIWLHDQDVLNYYFKKQWFLLPPKWNRLADCILPFSYPHYQYYDIKDYANTPMLYHYASVNIKPWLKAVIPEKKHYIKYLKKSGYKEICFQSVSTHIFCLLLYTTIKYEIKKAIWKIFDLYNKRGF